MERPYKNVVVIGGSYVGKGTAQKLSEVLPPTHRVVLVEPHTHFHHIFAFPRFAVVPEHEHKAFIPYTALFASAPSPASHLVVTARVVHIDNGALVLDRDYNGSPKLPFEYLVVATGTLLSQPCAVQADEKPAGVAYLRQHQQQVRQANFVVIAGGGAAGVQMACDIKEIFPDKAVTLVQSRETLMPAFDRRLHDIIAKRFAELGINFITGRRVRIPQDQPAGSQPSNVELSDGTRISADLVIAATGQKANNALIQQLQPSDGQSLTNSANGMIRVRPTLQFADKRYSSLFAVGDIADTGAHKAARPGMVQADVVTANILALIEGRECSQTFSAGPAAIHLSLGMKQNVIFGNPNVAEGQQEPRIVEKYDGSEDMHVEGFWKRMGIDPSDGNGSVYRL